MTEDMDAKNFDRSEICLLQTGWGSQIAKARRATKRWCSSTNADLATLSRLLMSTAAEAEAGIRAH